MNKQDQVSYLANIYRVVLADGEVGRAEEKVFEGIARDIGAGYFERKQAKELAGQDEYELRQVSRWSDRIRNIEDMLFAASTNNAVDPGEKKLILDAAGSVGINKQQFEVIKSEAKERLREN